MVTFGVQADITDIVTADGVCQDWGRAFPVTINKDKDQQLIFSLSNLSYNSSFSLSTTPPIHFHFILEG